MYKFKLGESKAVPFIVMVPIFFKMNECVLIYFLFIFEKL